MAATVGTGRPASRSRAAAPGALVPRWTVGRAVPGAFGIAALATLLAPWSVLGTTSRSAFALGAAAAAAAAAAGLLPAGAARLLLVALDALPAAVACSCAAAVLGHARIAAGLAGAVAAVVLAASVVVLVVPGVGVQAGPWLGIGVVAAGAAGASAIGRRSSKRRFGNHG